MVTVTIFSPDLGYPADEPIEIEGRDEEEAIRDWIARHDSEGAELTEEAIVFVVRDDGKPVPFMVRGEMEPVYSAEEAHEHTCEGCKKPIYCTSRSHHPARCEPCDFKRRRELCP